MRSFLNLCLFITHQDVIGLQTAPSGTKLQDELSITSHLACIISVYKNFYNELSSGWNKKIQKKKRKKNQNFLSAVETLFSRL